MRNHMIMSALAAVTFLTASCTHTVSFHSNMHDSTVTSCQQVSKSDRANYTVAMVDMAIRMYDSQGRDATVEYYNSPESVDGEWYVVILDEDEKAISIAVNPDLLGEELRGDTGVDFTGYRHGEAIAGATEDGIWVDYFFINPITKRQEWKHSWAVRHDGLIFVSGWYQNLPIWAQGELKE